MRPLTKKNRDRAKTISRVEASQRDLEAVIISRSHMKESVC